ncbi:unnamed protein product [Heterobilharzia americana]|nr:unnamed protein product [Heterobilharzia americana]
MDSDENIPGVLLSLPTVRSNQTHRIIRIQWKLNTSLPLICPFNTYAFAKSDNELLEYQTDENHYQFESLKIDETYRVGVLVKSTQRFVENRMYVMCKFNWYRLL